jgi:hypothetical protein
MLSWFTSPKCQKVNFEEVQTAMQRSYDFYLINTLPLTDQHCLIQGTLDASREESILNEMLNTLNIPDKRIIVYGKHNQDDSVYTKAAQLEQLGVRDVYIYIGGMFEWLMLQDIYGASSFPTTTKELDLLRYRPPKSFL